MKVNPKLNRNGHHSYWAVFWGPVPTPEVLKSHKEALRLDFVKTHDPFRACNEAFGLVAGNMWVMNVGTNITKLRSVKFLTARLHSTKDWVRVGLPGEDCEHHWHWDPAVELPISKEVDRKKECPYCGQEPRKVV